jgi:hypothetical protein
MQRALINRLLVLSFFITAASLHAEDPYSYIIGAGSPQFSAGGAVVVPPPVLGAMKNGQISPIMQFVLMNNTVSSCVKKVQKEFPYRRDSFQTASAKFNAGYCKIRKCFDQAMMMAMLPELSKQPQAGGSGDPQDQQQSQMMGLVMSQAFSKEGSCKGGSASMDPTLLSMASGGQVTGSNTTTTPYK